MKRNLIIVLLLIGAHLSFSQNYESGYIIIQNNDTLFGEILYQDFGGVSNIKFKRSGSTQEYGPNEISRFSLNSGTEYVSNIIDDVFIEALVEGSLNLYRQKDTYYLTKEGERLVSLESERYVDNFTKSSADDSKWKGKLNYLTSDCGSGQQSLINRTEFNQIDISKVVTKYNQCQGDNSSKPNTSSKAIKIRYGAFIGGTQGSIKINRGEFDNDLWTDHELMFENTNDDFGPLVGPTFNFAFPRISKSLFLEINFLYSTAKSSSSEILSESGANAFWEFQRNTFYYEDEVAEIQVPFMIGNNFLLGNNIIRIKAGLNASFNQSQKSVYEEVRERLPIGETEVQTGNRIEDPLIEYKSSSIGITAGIDYLRALKSFNIGVGFRYISQTNTNEFDVDVNPSIGRNYVGFGLLIEKK